MLDLKIQNARIFTMDPRRPQATVMGILHGRIVGLDEEVSALSARRVVDCRGSVVVPGFSDSHNHMAWFGQSLVELDLSACTSPGELYGLVAAVAARLGDGEWVVGSGYDDAAMGSHPDRLELDKAAGGRPVWLKHRSGHMCTVNTEVLRRAGILDGTATIPAGGSVVTREGQLTGLLLEQAQKLVGELVLPYSVSHLADAIARASSVYAAEGLTHVTEAGIGAGWIGRSPVELAAYTEARNRGALQTRVQLMVSSDALHTLRGHALDGIDLGLDLGITTGFGDDRIRVGAMKIFVDGSLIGRTAAVTEPFCDHHHDSDGFQSSVEDIRAKIVDAHRSGWTVAAHAIGDEAIDVALDAFADAQRRHPRDDVRHRIEHAAMVRPDQIRRFAQLRVTPVPQMHFLHELGDSMLQAVGSRRESWTYRHRSFLDAGLRIPGSSDRPVASGAPLLGMQSMVLRKTMGGRVIGPEETVTADEALHAYTVDAAWAAGEEHRRGRLGAGMLADIVVLSHHPAEVPPQNISTIDVIATIVGGDIVHGGESLEAGSVQTPAPMAYSRS
ncbi:amidohydrolase [Rhodococcus jostii]|uniref:Amidohydrolase n=1 Tax=Rhodococcus jostii TaxID=132919 RepID=A0ABU4CS88_RHOJO|nr:amidohydrolase [Rhodococcus jostii]MDV6286323.1 amidohydrolase [Rhodococcus jostii]